MDDLAGIFVAVEVLEGKADAQGTVAVTHTPGLPVAIVAELLRRAADGLEVKQ